MAGMWIECSELNLSWFLSCLVFVLGLHLFIRCYYSGSSPNITSLVLITESRMGVKVRIKCFSCGLNSIHHGHQGCIYTRSNLKQSYECAWGWGQSMQGYKLYMNITSHRTENDREITQNLSYPNETLGFFFLFVFYPVFFPLIFFRVITYV